MIAKDVMTTAVVTVSAQTSVEEVARLLLKCRISAVPVVDAKAHVQGIVSEGDLIWRTESGTESRRSWWLDLLANRDGVASDYLKSHGRTANMSVSLGADLHSLHVGDSVQIERDRVRH